MNDFDLHRNHCLRSTVAKAMADTVKLRMDREGRNAKIEMLLVASF